MPETILNESPRARSIRMEPLDVNLPIRFRTDLPTRYAGISVQWDGYAELTNGHYYRVKFILKDLSQGDQVQTEHVDRCFLENYVPEGLVLRATEQAEPALIW